MRRCGTLTAVPEEATDALAELRAAQQKAYLAFGQGPD